MTDEITIDQCPACGATEDVEFVGVHHEIMAAYHCHACDNDWSE